MKIIVVSIFCLFFNTLSIAQSENQKVQRAIDSFVNTDGLENAAISFMAVDLTTNEVLGQHNERVSIPPASTVKLFTTAAAFEILGKDYTPKTKIYLAGTVDSLGTLHGNIIIRGLGDPTLGSLYFYSDENKNEFLSSWVQLISNHGIKSIDGRVIADGSSFGYNGAPDGWQWSDLGNYYGAGPSGIAVYDNMTQLHFSTSNQLNGPTSLDSLTPPIPGYELDNRVTTYNSSSDNAYIYGAPYANHRFATGKLPRGKNDFIVKASVPDPELLLAQVVENALKAATINVNSPAFGARTLEETIDYSSATLITTWEGKTIEDIVSWTNLRSVNFFAEQLLSLIGLEKTGSGETGQSADYINNFWTNKLGVKTFQRDGSGLSRSNGFSANHFTQLLKYMYHSKNFETFESTLPVAGVSGTLTRVCRGQLAQGKLKAKSGTMNKIKSYAGYIDASNGHKVAFSVTVNNYDMTNYQLTRQMEKVFNVIAQ